MLTAKLAAVRAHESQVLEWLPWIGGYAGEMPDDEAGRRPYADERIAAAARQLADQYRAALVARYGPEARRGVRHAEAYELSEYAAPLTDQAAAALFPFCPSTASRSDPAPPPRSDPVPPPVLTQGPELSRSDPGRRCHRSGPGSAPFPL